MASQSSGKIFNNDLLANPSDVSEVYDIYGPLEEVLYHRELVSLFNKYNNISSRAKIRSRALGKTALALGLFAIALAVAEIVGVVLKLDNERFSFALALLAACCGLLSIAIGGMGILFGKRKQEWLVNRFVGERIRQFHFQSLIMQFPEIVGFLLPGDKGHRLRAKFRSDRQRLFKQFTSELEGNSAARFTSVIGAHSEADFWLHSSVGPILPNLAGRPPGRSTGEAENVDIEISDPEPGSSSDEPVRIRSKDLSLFFEAYLHLRISHQMGYADYKLGNDHKFFSALPVRQAEILEAVTKIGIAWLFLIHAVVFLIAAVGLWVGSPTGLINLPVSYVFSVAIVVLAFMGLGVRAFQLGLQPEQEIERYQHYRSAVQSVLEQFQKAETVVEKLNSMWQMERVAFDEMRNFLLTSDRSSFVV